MEFPTTASLEGGDWGGGFDDWDVNSVSSSMTDLCPQRDFMVIISSPTSPDTSAVGSAKEEGPFIMPLGASAAVVNQSPGEAHITSRRYNMQWRLSFSKINCYLFTSRISHDISRREPEGIFSFCLSRCQCNRRSLSHPQILLKSQFY